ncbi:hypothetical protein HanIR_Chr10g0483211 [Helianthus annuus]|nr:hypothetical protein HanIR_Chr10g0483211 [Helianthus annuus]
MIGSYQIQTRRSPTRLCYLRGCSPLLIYICLLVAGPSFQGHLKFNQNLSVSGPISISA